MTTTTSGKGRTSGSGAFTSTAGDASVSSKGSEQSQGATSTAWKDVAFGGGSWGRGVVTTGGSRSGSSEVTPDGSAASQTTSGTGSHDVSGGTATPRYNPYNGALVATDVTGYSSKASGSNTTTAAAKDGLLTESTSGGSNGGTAVNFSQSKGDDGQFISSSYGKTTTTSNTKDGTFTGTDTNESGSLSATNLFTGVSRASSEYFDDPRDEWPNSGGLRSYDSGQVEVVIKSSSLATETVTHSPEGSSAKGAASSSQSNMTLVNGINEVSGSFELFEHFKKQSGGRSTSSSTYESSHDNGPHGAVGGKYASSSNYSSSGGGEIQWRFKTSDSSEGPYTHQEDFQWGDTSSHSSSDKGSYWDTVSGRYERGTSKWSNVSTSREELDEATQYVGADYTTRGNVTSRGYASGETKYGPEGSTSTSTRTDKYVESMNQRFQGVTTTYTDIYSSQSMTVDGVSSGYKRRTYDPDYNNQSYDVSWPSSEGVQQQQGYGGNNQQPSGVANNARHVTVKTGGVFASIGSALGLVGDFIGGVKDEVGSILSGPIESARNGTLVEDAKANVRGARDAITNAWDDPRGAANAVVEDVRQDLRDFRDADASDKADKAGQLAADFIPFFGWLNRARRVERALEALDDLPNKKSGDADFGGTKTTPDVKTNEELIQAVATRAEKTIGGTGAVPGTHKHKYAKDLLDRYQEWFGDRNLRTETSWKDGRKVEYGTKGSVRIDVLDEAARKAYDYKFTSNPPGLPQSQIRRILQHGFNIDEVQAINP